MCRLADVSRAGFYRYLRGRSRAEEEMTIRSAVQDIVLEHRWRYGYRRVTAELRAKGMAVNHKRIARIMQQDNLLAVRLEWLRPGQQQIRAVRIYLNLANRMTLSGLNQLWAADITYIRLACEFVYLAVVMDVFSRKVIGWALGRSLKAQHTPKEPSDYKLGNISGPDARECITYASRTPAIASGSLEPRILAQDH